MNMDDADSIEEERILTFLESMSPELTPFLSELEKEALKEEIPIIRPQTRNLIHFLLELICPEKILEVGTGTGFSACYMASYAPGDVKITTIEKDKERAVEAKKSFEHFGEKITLLEGDAKEILPELQGEYELIFMDAAKGQYGTLLPEVLRLLSSQGILLTDNILMGGEVLNSRFAVKRRDRTIHKKMREYLRELSQNPDLQTVLLQEGDGAALSVKKEKS